MSARRAAAISLARGYMDMPTKTVGADVETLAREFLSLYDDYSSGESGEHEANDFEYRQIALGYATASGLAGSHDVLSAAYMYRAFLQGRDEDVMQAIGVQESHVWKVLIFGKKD